MHLTPLFKPRTMAVCGVSLSNDTHPANVIYNKNNLRYPIETYALNPKGGTGVEIYQDTVLRMAPQTERDVGFMLDSLKEKALLTGYRGGTGINVA